MTSSVIFHTIGYHNDRSALCLYTKGVWCYAYAETGREVKMGKERHKINDICLWASF